MALSVVSGALAVSSDAGAPEIPLGGDLATERAGKTLKDLAGITLGTALTAAGLNFFLVPNRLNDGGLAGLAVVGHYLFGLPVGYTLLALNIPLLLVTSYLVGFHFGAKTVFGSLALALFLQFLPARPITSDLLLSSVYGGILSGTGLGLAFRFGGSTGGSDLVARILRHYFRTTLGQGLLGTDFVVITVTGLALGARGAMYSLFALFISSRMVDLIQEGIDFQKAAVIIAREPGELADRILRVLGRGVTGLQGRGMYTRQDREVLLVVTTRSEVSLLKELVYRHDPKAFMVITDAYEVLGEGFAPAHGSPAPGLERK